jgi:hypothetical protein
VLREFARAAAERAFIPQENAVMDSNEILCRDRLRVVSNSGAIYPIQIGVVMGRSISLFDTSIPVQAGDSIWHVLPDGQQVEYLVANPGFCTEHRELPASYNATVTAAVSQRPGPPLDHPDALMTTQLDHHGERTRHTVAQLAMFRDLRRATGGLPKALRPSATGLVAAMEAAKTQPARIRAYQQFIGFVVDYIGVYQQTLVALTLLLGD